MITLKISIPIFLLKAAQSGDGRCTSDRCEGGGATEAQRDVRSSQAGRGGGTGLLLQTTVQGAEGEGGGEEGGGEREEGGGGGEEGEEGGEGEEGRDGGDEEGGEGT